MLWPDASTNLGPSLQCDLKKNQSQKVKFTNSCKGNLRRWKIGIGQNDFVTVTHFGQGMEQVRWQDDWNSFQTSHFFSMQKILVFRRECLSFGSQRNDCSSIHATFPWKLSEFRILQIQKVTFNFHSQKKSYFCWKIEFWRNIANYLILNFCAKIQ